MTQSDLGSIPNSTSGPGLAALLRNWRDAVESSHSGAARPGYLDPGGLWLDTSAAPWKLKLWTGQADAVVGLIDPATGGVTTFDARFLRFDADQALTAPQLAQARKNLRAILGGWYEVSRVAVSSGMNWLFDFDGLSPSATGYRLSFRGCRPNSGAASLLLRCGSAGASTPADAASGDYYAQDIRMQAGTFVSGAATQSAPSSLAFSAGASPRRAVVEGMLGSADDTWTAVAIVNGSLPGSAIAGMQFSTRTAVGRKPRLFITSDVALVAGDIILEARD